MTIVCFFPSPCSSEWETKKITRISVVTSIAKDGTTGYGGLATDEEVTVIGQNRLEVTQGSSKFKFAFFSRLDTKDMPPYERDALHDTKRLIMAVKEVLEIAWERGLRTVVVDINCSYARRLIMFWITGDGRRKGFTTHHNERADARECAMVLSREGWEDCRLEYDIECGYRGGKMRANEMAKLGRRVEDHNMMGYYESPSVDATLVTKKVHAVV